MPDEVICLEMPDHFQAIGEWYEDFAQTSDEEVVTLLRAGQADDGQEEQVRERQADRPQGNVPDQATDGQAEPAAEQAPIRARGRREPRRA